MAAVRWALPDRAWEGTLGSKHTYHPLGATNPEAAVLKWTATSAAIQTARAAFPDYSYRKDWIESTTFLAWAFSLVRQPWTATQIVGLDRPHMSSQGLP